MDNKFSFCWTSKLVFIFLTIHYKCTLIYLVCFCWLNYELKQGIITKRVSRGRRCYIIMHFNNIQLTHWITIYVAIFSFFWESILICVKIWLPIKVLIPQTWDFAIDNWFLLWCPSLSFAFSYVCLLHLHAIYCIYIVHL
jgi:hypothetical protein